MDISTGHPLAVVTGASNGIGLELARQFGQHGFDLVVAAEDDGISPAAQELAAENVKVTPVQTDLAEYDGVEKLVERVRADGRPVAAVAVNAGVGVGGDFARDTDLQDELRLIALNVTSSVHLAKRMLPEMVARGSGKVLFTSSIAATSPGPWEAAYAASKAFLYSFSEAIRHELHDTGVTVTALLPGPTETEFFERAGMQDTRVATIDKSDPADVARDGFEALMAGKHSVVSGALRDKMQATAGKSMPEPAKAKMHGAQSKPGSGKSS